MRRSAADSRLTVSGRAKVARSVPYGGRMVEHGVGRRMVGSCETTPSLSGHRPPDRSLLDAWFELNYRLQEEAAVDTQIDRTLLEQWTMRLWSIVSPRPQCFWLFLARINELGLLCASRYVDCCEFAAADELLVEPGSVLLHAAGAVGGASRDRGAVCGRALDRVPGGIKPGPVLPCLYDLLKGSGYMTDDYLHSISRRMDKVAQVAEMLKGLGIINTENIARRLSCMDVDQRRDFRSRLCLFDRKTFNEIGRALHLFMRHGKIDDEYVGKYLRA